MIFCHAEQYTDVAVLQQKAFPFFWLQLITGVTGCAILNLVTKERVERALVDTAGGLHSGCSHVILDG